MDRDPKKEPIRSFASKYTAASVAARAQARKQERTPLIPNIAQADAAFDPKRDGPMTPAQIAAEQRSATQPQEAQQQKPAGLSEQTIEGLKQLKVEAARAEAAAPPKAPDPIAAEHEGLDDLEVSALLDAIKKDALNNQRERDAVAARVEPIDFAAGLLYNEFTQRVPVIPGQLEVLYRTFTSLEHQHLRLYLAAAAAASPELNAIAPDLLGLYQTVASVVSINGTALPPHIVKENGKLRFDTDGFEQKLERVMNFPLPVVHALGVHGAWFDGRVRALFVTADTLKNG